MRAWIGTFFIVVTMALGTARLSAQSTQPAVAAPASSPEAAPVPPGNLIKRGSPMSSPAASPPPTTTGGALRLAGSLAAVLGLIVLMYWGTRRLLPGSGIGRSSGAIHVLARTHLSPKQRILLIQVGGRVLVVGDGGGQLNTLCEINDPDEAAALIGQIQGERVETGGRSFASMFASANDRLSSTKEAPKDEIEAAREQLDGLMHQVRGMTRQIDRP